MTRASRTLPLLATILAGCTNASAPPDIGSSSGLDGGISTARGIPFPMGSPWLSFYGNAAQAGDLTKMAQRFRLINIDADPDQNNFTTAQITQLKAGGQNRVISYLNVGACEDTRVYWANVPAPYVSCAGNKAAQLSTYAGYPHEIYMDVGNPDYQRLIVEYLAPRLVAMGVDGFFLDNMEVIENQFQQGMIPGNAMTPRGCNSACSQGGLDLVARLRGAYPDLLIVMQNATSDVTRLGTTGGAAFRSLLDGISHEDVYDFGGDAKAMTELANWKNMNLMVNGRPFWIATEDYGAQAATNVCPAASVAQPMFNMSTAAGYSPYVTDASAGQKIVCYWTF